MHFSSKICGVFSSLAGGSSRVRGWYWWEGGRERGRKNFIVVGGVQVKCIEKVEERAKRTYIFTKCGAPGIEDA